MQTSVYRRATPSLATIKQCREATILLRTREVKSEVREPLMGFHCWGKAPPEPEGANQCC